MTDYTISNMSQVQTTICHVYFLFTVLHIQYGAAMYAILLDSFLWYNGQHVKFSQLYVDVFCNFRAFVFIVLHMFSLQTVTLSFWIFRPLPVGSRSFTTALNFKRLGGLCPRLVQLVWIHIQLRQGSLLFHGQFFLLFM